MPTDLTSNFFLFFPYVIMKKNIKKGFDINEKFVDSIIDFNSWKHNSKLHIRFFTLTSAKS